MTKKLNLEEISIRSFITNVERVHGGTAGPPPPPPPTYVCLTHETGCVPSHNTQCSWNGVC